MIVIRQQQREILQAASQGYLIEIMVGHVQWHFPIIGAGLHADSLRGHLRATLRHAQDLGLCAPRDLCRFLNLACTYGWDFASGDMAATVHAYLRDAAVSSPSDRLDLLIRHCQHRQALLVLNDARRSEFGIGDDQSSAARPTPVRPPIPDEPSPDEVAEDLPGAAAWLAQQLCMPANGNGHARHPLTEPLT